MRLILLVGAYEVSWIGCVCIGMTVITLQRLGSALTFCEVYIYVVNRFCMHSPAPIRLP